MFLILIVLPDPEGLHAFKNRKEKSLSCREVKIPMLPRGSNYLPNSICMSMLRKMLSNNIKKRTIRNCVRIYSKMRNTTKKKKGKKEKFHS